MKSTAKLTSLILGLSLSAFSLSANANCTKDQAKGAVEKVCGIIAAKGKAGLGEAAKYRYCGSNYVWIQGADVKMIMHPIKPRLNGKSLKANKDKKGKLLFVEFDKAANANAGGAWVEYYWPKPGAEEATPKVSFVKKCGGSTGFIAGSGIWK